MGILREDVRTFMTISRSFLFRMRNVANKFVDKIKTHFMFSNSPPPPQNRAVYEVMWGNMVEPDRPQIT